MFLVSQMIYDPNVERPNRMGLTIGLTVRTSKYWDCKKYDFLVSQFDDMHHRHGEGLSEETMERRYQAVLAHRNCTKKHRSHVGYAYWTGPKRRYTFRYMGPVWRGRDVWWKPFSVRKHGRYTQWFVGKQPEGETQPLSAEHIEILKKHREEFSASMQKSREQMRDYIAKREGTA
jgi:hypothetical protein